MQLFFSNNIHDSVITLDNGESHHCVKTLRHVNGDIINITDGNGNLYECEIINASPTQCVTQIKNFAPHKDKPTGIHIAIAPTKNIARIEWFVEKAVETGIDRITLLTCQHSERTTVKTDRLEKIALSAMKQSLRTVLPVIDHALTFQDFVGQSHHGELFIAHCLPDTRTTLTRAHQPGMPAIVLIGPEGDFSADEVGMALSHGYQPISLGEARLRTETAALVAAFTINLVNTMAS